MIHFFRIKMILLAILSLGACAAAPAGIKLGQDFDVSAFTSKIEQGVTTQDQVRSWLGEPEMTGASMGTDGQGYEEWTYYSAKLTAPNLSLSGVKMLQIKFDKTGVARAYSWSAAKQP